MSTPRRISRSLSQRSSSPAPGTVNSQGCAARPPSQERRIIDSAGARDGKAGLLAPAQSSRLHSDQKAGARRPSTGEHIPPRAPGSVIRKNSLMRVPDESWGKQNALYAQPAVNRSCSAPSSGRPSSILQAIAPGSHPPEDPGRSPLPCQRIARSVSNDRQLKASLQILPSPRSPDAARSAVASCPQSDNELRASCTPSQDSNAASNCH